MNFRVASLALLLSLVPSGAFAQEAPLRALEPLVAELMRTPEPDRRDLCDVGMRGAALFMALAAHVPRETAEQQALASGLQRQALPFYQVAIASGLLLNQNVATTQQQLQRFLEAYTALMQRARERGDTILPPSIRQELQAILPVVPLMTMLAEEYEKVASEQATSAK